MTSPGLQRRAELTIRHQSDACLGDDAAQVGISEAGSASIGQCTGDILQQDVVSSSEYAAKALLMDGTCFLGVNKTRDDSFARDTNIFTRAG